MPQRPQPIPRTPSDAEADREFTATVTEIRELRRVAGKPLFQIALDSSNFTPVHDAEGIVGTVTATSRLGSVLIAPILSVERDGTGELWHTTAKPLQPGTVVLCRPAHPPRPATEQ